MKKKPAISLIRGNTPKIKYVRRSSYCWGCNEKTAKNDVVFDVPGPTRRNKNGKYYKENHKRYCKKCMDRNFARTEKELKKLKDASTG